MKGVWNEVLKKVRMPTIRILAVVSVEANRTNRTLRSA